ncbi:MAG TPA: SprT family zinc-dependent metalloprotease [Solirubrobacteraceae bacterium]|nr:SprT family zinc-dependent metalloprotease [Solirubrobacteraceae bacterium]
MRPATLKRDPHFEEIPYTIRRSSRARSVRINVHADAEVEVVLPERAPERAAASAVEELRPWIERRLAEARRTLAVIAGRGASVPYLGTPLELIPEEGRVRVRRRGDTLLVPDADPRAALERFYRRAARNEVGRRLDRATALTGVPYNGLSIRGQRTRWASCSSDGHMSFNWRLMLAPEPVLDYVVWHEVCHLEVSDHSRRFWGLLGRRWPEYRAHRRWLRDHGATLVLA